jgi:hypothetical protein
VALPNLVSDAKDLSSDVAYLPCFSSMDALEWPELR